MAVFRNLLKHIYRKALNPIYRQFDEFVEFNAFDDEIKGLNKNILYILEYKKQSSAKRKKVIYTCITDMYDEICQHTYINFDYDYICFSDNNELLKLEEYGIWKIRPLEYTKFCNTKNSRWHKMHPHILFPDYDESIWIDANINIVTDYLFDLIKPESKYKIKIPLHFDRNCIYQEIKSVLYYGKDSKEATDKVLELLEYDNFPENYGLNETCIIYREHNDKEIIEIMNSWWEMIEHYSKRDQLSLSYILWKKGIVPKDIGIPNATIDNTNNNSPYAKT